MKTVCGNLLDLFDNKQFNIIVHGCNCYQNMGGGIAHQIAERYPKVEQADNNTQMGSKMKLGTVECVRLSWAPLTPFLGIKPKIIINAYTQEFPGSDARVDAIRTAFYHISLLYEKHNWSGLRIGIPEIGCGIGGLNWPNVVEAINESCSNIDLTVVQYI